MEGPLHKLQLYIFLKPDGVQVHKPDGAAYSVVNLVPLPLTQGSAFSVVNLCTSPSPFQLL